MGLDDTLQRLDSISGDTKAGKFAAKVAQYLRGLRAQVHSLAGQKVDLERELHQVKIERDEAKRAAARRLGEIENLLESNRRCKEKLEERR